MLRGCLLAKYGVVRLTGASLKQNSPKWLSAVAANNPAPAKSEENPGEQTRIRSPLESKIFSAVNLNELGSAVKSEDFNGSAAVSTVNVLGSWVTAGKLSVADFQTLEYKSKLEELILEGKFNVNITTAIQGIKSLHALGFPPTSKVVNSLENEILWLLRKVAIRQHFQVLDFHSTVQETDMKTKIVKEAVSNIQRRWVEIVEAKEFASLFRLASHFSPKFIEKMEDILVELVETYSQADRALVLNALGVCQRRSTPLLRALCYHMNKCPEALSLKMIVDTLFALNRLSFHDQVLIERICNDLVSQLTPDVKSAHVGSILTSFGHLKYRHEAALDALCEWINQNWPSVRKQDVVSLLISMATVDFLPSNWEILWPKIKEMLNEELKSPTWNAFVHLDVAWSLTVLNHLEPAVIQSVLNDSFVSKIMEQAGANNTGVKIKLNQIWAASSLNSTKISNLKVKMPYDIKSVAKPTALQQAVSSALGHFIPIGKYLKLNSQTSLGIDVDGECIMNNKFVPVPIEEYKDAKKPLPANTYRVAVLVQDYKDLCKGRIMSTGIQGLKERLLKQSGYRVVKVSYCEFDPKAKLVKQLQLLEQLVKGATSS